jgi:hypothetical protein
MCVCVCVYIYISLNNTFYVIYITRKIICWLRVLVNSIINFYFFLSYTYTKEYFYIFIYLKL